MNGKSENRGPSLLDERTTTPFRAVFGERLSRSRQLDTAIQRVRLSRVDLSAGEVGDLERLRVLVAEVNARTLEEEAFALLVDPEKRENLSRIVSLLQQGIMELRSAPLGGWSPDFSVFSGADGPHSLILGLHWIQRPFPHRGPAFAACFGQAEAIRAHRRFEELWGDAHEIGPAIRKLLERAEKRQEEDFETVDTISGLG